MMELVSVVIPTYQGAATICRAVDSALNQDYPYIEVIVVDDNGLETPAQRETEKALQRYGQHKNGQRVIYLAHPRNKNGAAARNTGARAAKGKYIALLDDDDVFLPFKIRLQLEALSGENLEALSREKPGATGEKPEALSRETPGALSKHKLEAPPKQADSDYAVCYTAWENIFTDGRRRIIPAVRKGDLCYPLLAMEVSMLSSVLLIRKDAWESVGGFDESFKRDQDQEFCARLFQKYKAVVVPEVCMVRHIVKRNVPQDVEKSIGYRLYYLDKMKGIIETFDKNEQQAIYSANYIEMAKRYFKAGKPLKCAEYLVRSKTPVRGITKLARSYWSYRKNVKEGKG